MKFSEIQLHPLLQANLDEIQFVECTKIQEQGIPWARKGKDISGLAQTGTGKTGAFLIPVIDRVLKAIKPEPAIAESETSAFPEWKRREYILVLVPTRELAEQVQETAQKFLKNTGLSSVAVYGGTSYEKQTAAMKNGVEFVIATPGRLIDLYKEHIVDLGLIRAIIFDEADRMFDMGFKDDMKFVLRRVPKDRQFMVFSATLNFDVLNVAYEFGADPVEINISRDQAKAENVKDNIFHVGHDEKPAYLLSLLKKGEPKQAIIFSNFKHNVERIARFLNANGIPTVGISSLLTQAQRNRVMEQFKGQNDRNILVATDLAARGLDIFGVDLVVNFELPDDPENYVHRIGRTGRAGATGTAYSLVSDRDVDALQRIEEYLKHKVDALWIEDSELVKEFAAFPRDEGRFNKGPSFRDRGPRREGRSGGGGGGDRDRNRNGRDRGRDRHRDDRPREDRPREARPRDDRPREDRPREDRPRADHPRGRGGEAQRGGEVHRDRHRGRNVDGQRRREGGPRSPQQGQHQGRHSGQRHGGGGGRHHQQSGGGRTHHAGQRPHRSAGAPIAASAQGATGLGSKVSGFFKKLFGKD